MTTDTANLANTGPKLVWLSPAFAKRLFIPDTDFKTQARCLAFFVPNWLKRQVCLLVLGARRWIRADFLVKESSFETAPAPCAALAALAATVWQNQPHHLAFLLGSPGPYQKLAAFVTTTDHAFQFFLKLSMWPTADQAVDNEAAWLSRLVNVPVLHGQIPELLIADHLPNGRAYLVTNVARICTVSVGFDKWHSRFLADLGQATQKIMLYRLSAEVAYISSTLTRLTAIYDASVYEELTAAWVKVQQRLASWAGPMVVAHRDFAPWNIRSDTNHTYVFDWEYAVAEANPLHDFFHFHLMQMVLTKKQAVTPSRLTALRGAARGYARFTYPSSQWDAAVINALLLAYLLDVIVFYTDSAQSFDPAHPVLATYIALVRSHSLLVTAWEN